MVEDEITKSDFMKYVLPCAVITGIAMTAFWAFNDHYLSIREHEDYKTFIGAEVTRIDLDSKSKVSREEFAEHIVYHDKAMAELQRQLAKVEEDVKDGVIARATQDRLISSLTNSPKRP
jgi:hypothetical protein